MRRRTLLKMLGSAAMVTAMPQKTFAGALSPPSDPDWSALRSKVGSRLIPVVSPLQACAKAGGAGAETLFPKFKNPYYLGGHPALTQTLGWIDAWTSQASDYAVVAETAADVAAAVDFARRNGIRLVIKGGGHSYFGNSNASGSLLVWTRNMHSVILHDAFLPIGAPPSARGIGAVSVGAGAIWGEVYKKVAVEGGRYVQGGGCLTVGVAGFIQGGGFGSFSKTYSTGAANLLEAEVVTADGKVRIANAYQEPELFYALKGGGGGTYGVVTRLTLKTHPLPSSIGAILFSIQAKSPAAWHDLVARMIDFYTEALFSPVWGEQMNFRPGWKLSVSMLCHGLDGAAIKAVWEPFLSWIRQHPQDYMIASEPMVLSMPAQNFWDPATLKSIPGVVLQDDTPGASPNNIFWATNQGEAGQVLHAYQSAWMPSNLLDTSRRSKLVDALVEASAHWAVGLHTNKGLAGGTPEALQAAKATSTNPDVGEAFALLICAAEGPPAWPDIPGHEPDAVTGRSEAAKVARAMTPIHALVPGAGSYISEADYFGVDWQRAYWGDNYERLVAAKRRYDPGNLFKGHHCVA